jgi:hypothetical protein
MKGVEIYHVEHTIGPGNTDNATALKDSNRFDDATSVLTTYEGSDISYYVEQRGAKYNRQNAIDSMAFCFANYVVP